MIRRLFYIALGARPAPCWVMRRLQALHPRPRGPPRPSASAAERCRTQVRDFTADALGEAAASARTELRAEFGLDMRKHQHD